MKRVWVGFILAVAMVIGVVVGVGAQGVTYVLNLLRGETALVRCQEANRLRVERVDGVTTLLICGRGGVVVPTATVAPPTATPVVGHEHGEEVDLYWHPPGAHGDRPAHEHGDAPPQWLLDAGVRPSFVHIGGTPGENHAYYKHTGFKGWSGQFNGQDWYGVFHLDFNPAGRASRFHSYQLWVKDDLGGVSAISGWLDFGVGNNTGPNLVLQCGGDDGVRPIMNPPSVGCPIAFESWYARAGGNGDWAPDFGFNVNPNYYAGGDPNDPATWVSTGYVRNLERRIEFAWYLGVNGIRPAPRGEFWTTQWGEYVSGPNDPVCGTQRAYGERVYTVVCLRQYVTQALRPMVFPGNSTGGVFPGVGVVVLPN